MIYRNMKINYSYFLLFFLETFFGYIYFLIYAKLYIYMIYEIIFRSHGRKSHEV